MRIQFLILLLLPLLSFSQIKINGLVSSENQRLANALVVVYSADSSETIAYTSCDIKGQYELSLANGKVISRVFVGPEISRKKILRLQAKLKSQYKLMGLVRKFKIK